MIELIKQGFYSWIRLRTNRAAWPILPPVGEMAYAYNGQNFKVPRSSLRAQAKGPILFLSPEDSPVPDMCFEATIRTLTALVRRKR